MIDKLCLAVLAVLASEKGVSMVEYGVLLAMVAAACVTGLRGMSGGISNTLTYTAGQL